MTSEPKKAVRAVAHSRTPRPRGDRKMPVIRMDEDSGLHVDVETNDHLRDLYGVRTREAAQGILLSAMAALGERGELYRDLMAAIAIEMEPRNAVEAMLLSQQVATHAAMMTLSGKVMDAQSPQLREGYERSMTRLSRTYLAQMDALKRYRSKAQQTVRVERVDVYEGGQAIVGAVQTGGGDGEEK